MIHIESVADYNKRGYNLVVTGLIIIFAGLLFFASCFSPQYSVMHNLLYVAVSLASLPFGGLFITAGLFRLRKPDGRRRFTAEEL